MKRTTLLLALCALLALPMMATDLSGKRFYINPGHGSFGPNDRPMATIPYPNLPTTGMPDTCGFYETNTNLWKCLYLGQRLKEAGATVLFSRTKNGPWPYAKVNGDYPDYTTAGYKALPDYEKYNRNLTEICEEVEANNIDYFISVHSNAATDGSTANYPLFLYRGKDGQSEEAVAGSYAKAAACWAYRNGIMLSGIDPSTSYKTSTNLRGDISFYGSSSTRTSAYSGKQYTGYLGVLKHGASGYLVEGYFHTYQPARHRALNPDYCHQEGLAYYRGIVDYYNAGKDTKGYIMGTIKDVNNRMSNNLFQYSPQTNDQWVPCNGAVVTLYKGGVKVADYQVDNNYNGIFVFENLEPGNDYTLDAVCEGYHPLTDEYKTPLTVKANETTYPFIFLADTSWTPPAVVYRNYPEPDQPAYLQVASSYEMKAVYTANTIVDMDGLTIRRVLYRNGLMYVLAIDNQRNPVLLEVNPDTQAIVSEIPTNFCSVASAEGFKLSDIAFTADGYLVGCNMEAVAYTPTNKWNIYKWEKGDTGWTGALWFNTTNNETAGNFLNAMVGASLAYSGTTADGTLVSEAYTTGSDAHNMRFVIYTIVDNAYAGAVRNVPATNIPLRDYGHEIQMVVSPRDSTQFVFFSPNKNAFEWKVNPTTNTAPTIVGTMPFHTITANFFRYAGRSMMACPAEDAQGKNVGVALYDITEGVDMAEAIATTNTTLESAAATYTMACGAVNNADITLFLAKDNTFAKFTTEGVAQPVIPHINAYNLRMTYDANAAAYTFTYTTNMAANSVALNLYQEGTQIGSIALPAAVKGDNEATINVSELPDFTGEATWALELTADAVANWGQLFADNSMLRTGTTRVFNAVDNSPESDYFGRLYIMRRAGSSGSAERPYSGLYAYNQDYTLVSENLLKGGVEFGNPARLNVAPDGYVYQADWSDGYSGVYVINPADLEGTFTQFFLGTRNSSGLFTNNGVQVGSSSPGLGIYGTGEDTRLIVYNEDAGGTLPANGLAIYNIGQADGTMAHSWGVAPSSTITLTMQANTEGTPVGTSHGVFVSQQRASGNNNTAAPSLMFVDYNGTLQMASCYDPYKEMIDGSDGGGYAVSADEKMLVLQGGKKQFYVFDIDWQGDKPVLNLRYEYTHGIQTIRQMNFDFAGNLVCSGEAGVHIFTMPTDNNSVVVPAKQSLKVSKNGSGTDLETFEQNGPAVLDLNQPMYDILGRPVDAHYRGIVIQNGNKFLR